MRPGKAPVGAGTGNVEIESGEKQVPQDLAFDSMGSGDQPPITSSPKLNSTAPQPIPISSTYFLTCKEQSNDEDATLEITDELPLFLESTPSLIA